MKTKTATIATPGVIRPDEVYEMGEFRARANLKGAWAWRQVVRDGLRVLRIGNTRYIRGKDFFAYLERISNQKSNQTNQGDSHREQQESLAK